MSTWIASSQKVSKTELGRSFLSPKDLPALQGQSLKCDFMIDKDTTGSGAVTFQLVIADNFHFDKAKVIGNTEPIPAASLTAGKVVSFVARPGAMLFNQPKKVFGLASAQKLNAKTALPAGKHYLAARFVLRGEVQGVFSARLTPQ